MSLATLSYSNLKTKPKILLGVCAPLVLLLILGGVSMFSINSIVNTNRWVQHTHNVLAEASGIVGSAVDMETGMRGFLLAGKEEFLDPYNNGQEKTYAAIEQLQETVSDNPGQVARLGEVEATLREWQEKVTEPTIALRREIGDAKTMDDMADLVGEARGKKFFDKFRGQIATFIGREEALLEKRRADLERASKDVINNIDVINDTIGWVEHTYRVIDQANAILAAAVDMETGMRGYLLAGKEEFLEPYNGGSKAFFERVASLSKTVSDNPAQVELLKEIETNIKAWQTEVTEPTIALRREIGDARTMNDMAALVGEARGKVFFDKFRALMADFAAEEQGLMVTRQEANKSTVSFTNIAIVVSVLVGLAAGALLAWFIGNGISNPLVAMTSAMRRLAEGDNEVEIPGVGRVDEIGEMADTVQVFKDNAIEKVRLQAEQAEREKRSEQEKREAQLKMADDLESSVKSVVQGIAGASTEMRSTAEGMAASAGQASEQSTAVAGSTEQASANVQTVAAAAEELSSSINEISRQISESRDVTDQAQETSHKASETIRKLADMAEKIGNVVNLINDIAEQTNLLALNATIEAARAGEAGKGFAVVASEVKSLASQTATATEEISGQISGMQAATEDSVNAIEQIRDVIGKLGETATAVSAAVEEQSASTQEISRNAQEAAVGTQTVSTNIASVQSAVSETGSSAQQVLDAASELSQQSEALDKQMDKFLADIRAA